MRTTVALTKVHSHKKWDMCKIPKLASKCQYDHTFFLPHSSSMA